MDDSNVPADSGAWQRPSFLIQETVQSVPDPKFKPAEVIAREAQARR